MKRLDFQQPLDQAVDVHSPMMAPVSDLSGTLDADVAPRGSRPGAHSVASRGCSAS
jgi:hypothetical protein